MTGARCASAQKECPSSQSSEAFKTRDQELRARGFRPIQARVALARHACRLCWRLLQTQQPFDERRYAHARQRGR